MGRKQPKTCVWVSAVGRERNFAKVSALLGIGVLIIIATNVWYFYRIIAGFIRFNGGRAVAPEKWI
ncbi:hypothetical protein HHC06_07455 [Neisseria meningitidis]|nr:hypothetical protein [Neisseria meningitidis]MBW3924593.1 hypothetical protein [Neisseria meningitidis]